ncbi:BspA family leucine-rich repeat surface protein [Pedobacter xixiisoli]|nr:BspA family leucine-rich repeat surface protein [Pedobacter xixiisoli]
MKIKLLLIPLLFSCIIKISLAANPTSSLHTKKTSSLDKKTSSNTTRGSVNDGWPDVLHNTNSSTDKGWFLTNRSSGTTAYRNTAPVLTLSAGNTTYTLGSVAIDGGLTSTDADNTTLASATISITNGFSPGDVLLFSPFAVSYGNITSAYDPTTGVLTLTSAGATATMANWQALLRNIRLSATSNGNTRDVSFVISDGTLSSATVTKTIDIPALLTSRGSTPYMAGGVVADDMVSITNANSTGVTTATVSITANRNAADVLAFIADAAYGNITSNYNSTSGELTLSSAGNTATVAQWQAALRSVKFIAATNGAVRTLTFKINGTATATKSVKSTLDFITVWDMSKPGSPANEISFRLAGSSTVGFTWTTIPASSFSGSGNITVSSSLATKTITNSFPKDAIIQLSFDGGSIRGFSIRDGVNAGQRDKARFIDIKAWGSAPWTNLSGVAYQAPNFNLTAKDAPVLTGNPSFLYAFTDCTSFTGEDSDLSAWNTSNLTNLGYAFRGATLFNHNISSWNVSNVTSLDNTFTNASSFNQNLGSWNLNAGVNLSGTLVNSGLDCVNYSSTLVGWSQGSATGRALGAAGLKYGLNATAARNILTTPVIDGGKGWTITDDVVSSFNCPNSSPIVTTGTDHTAYISNAVVIDNTLTLTDADHATLASAKISIANNHTTGDVLAFTADAAYGNITANYNTTTGVLTLNSVNATATLAEWQAALRSVTFQKSTSNTNNNRTISFTASDGDIYGPAASKIIDIHSYFITTWDLSKAGNSPTQIRFNSTVTGGGANYTWTTIPAGASGSGTIPDGTAAASIISGLPAGAIIELSIEPNNFKTFAIANGSDRRRLIDVKAWGTGNWISMQDAFYGASNLTITATDVPNLTGVTSMDNMFRDCTNLNGPANIGAWNTSNVTTMNGTFYNAAAFNQNISNWNIGNVTNTSSMFRSALAFNQNIKNWNIASVTEMGYMFNGATQFNMDLGNWALNPNVNLINTLNNAGISCSNYSKTLIAWSNLSVTGRNLGAVGLRYGTNATTSHTTLTTPIGSGGKGWTISDAGTSGSNCDNAIPVITTSAGNTTYNNTAGIVVDNALVITDADNTTLASATVKISNNPTTENTLAFTPSSTYGNISSTYNNATGVLALTSTGATATLAQWEAALRSIVFSTTSPANINTINFEVYDGNAYSVVANKTITIPAFVTTWDLGKGTTGTNKIRFKATVTGGGANYTWNTVPAAISGSGTIPDVNNALVTIPNLPADWVIELSIEPGNLKAFTIDNGADRTLITDVKAWGGGSWTNLSRAFLGANNLNITATDVPNLAKVASMANMFQNCTSLNSPSNINSWNTANVSDMSGMFYGATVFNQSLNNWNVSNVSLMNLMFRNASAFNQNIGNWNTISVTNMANMFQNAVAFNQNIGNWNTANVTDMGNMFNGATAFNENIGNWNTASATNISSMFAGATAFNQDIGNWITTSATTMANMFNGATVFNQNIGNWNTANVTNMTGMFYGAIAFNQNLNTWDVSKVVLMNLMFRNARAFNQNIGNWNTSSATNMANMFQTAVVFNQNIGNWNTASVTDMGNMFNGAIAFNQNIGNWNTASATNISSMFAGATAFNQNIGNWNTVAATNMANMLNGATAFNQNLGNLQLAATVNLTNMLNNSGMSCTNYSKTLIGWSSLSVTGRTLGATGIKYGTNADVARTTLTTATGSGGKGWTITDAGSSGANCDNVASPIVTTSAGSTTYNATVDVIIDNTVTVTDADNISLASAKVSITNNFVAGDVLTFTDGAAYGNITSAYNSTTGVLTLSSVGVTATLAEWQAALRSVTFRAASGTTTKTVSFEAFDGDIYSNIATKTLEAESVLSVNLVSFTATAQTNKALLQWSTNAELNNNYFEIERTTDGVNFISIAKVNGKGTTNQTSRYSTYDLTPINGVNYYRLKQVDLDGKATLLETRELRFSLDKQLTVTLYPNPVSETINLVFSGYGDINTKVVITNILGQVVHQEDLKINAAQSDYRLNLIKALNPGQYILRVNGKGLAQTIKLIAK